jgi:predicted MPP superfamily phosphohydrolase
MPTPPLPDSVLIEALNLAEEYGTGHMAKKAGKWDGDPRVLDRRILVARTKGLKPTVKKDAPRIYTRQRLGRMHMVIPDTQVKPGVNIDHLEWAGNYASEKKPDVIVMIGDWFDMPSLSSYDKGKMSFEGRRYVNDIKAGRNAMERFLKALNYNPRLVFTLGNHEHRIIRYADSNPELSGKLSFDDLGLKEYGWEVHDFLKPVEIDGVQYCHYFTSGAMGRPVTSAAALLRTRQQSCTMGHVQHTDLAFHPKTQNIACFAGTFYQHDEDYLSYQGNVQRRQILIKHEVEEGKYDPLFVSLRFLEKAYS